MILAPSRAARIISRLGLRSAIFFLGTLTLAAAQGLLWANVMHPGNGAFAPYDTGSGLKAGNSSMLDSLLLDVAYRMIPPNIVTAATSFNALGLLTFSLMIGVFLKPLNAGVRDVVLRATFAVQQCCHRALLLVIRFAPLGVLSVTASAIAQAKTLTPDDKSSIHALGHYLATTLVAQIGFAGVVYPLILLAFTNVPALDFYWKIRLTLLTAFATSSSAASLPVAIRIADNVCSIEPSVGEFMLTWGAVFEKPGTCLQYCIMFVYAAQMFEYELSIATQSTVACLAIVASIGALPIPSGWPVYISALLFAAGGPLKDGASQAQILALLVAWDFLIDRIATTVNVLSNNIAALVIEQAAEEKVDTFFSRLFRLKKHDA